MLNPAINSILSDNGYDGWIMMCKRTQTASLQKYRNTFYCCFPCAFILVVYWFIASLFADGLFNHLGGSGGLRSIRITKIGAQMGCAQLPSARGAQGSQSQPKRDQEMNVGGSISHGMKLPDSTDIPSREKHTNQHQGAQRCTDCAHTEHVI